MVQRIKSISFDGQKGFRVPQIGFPSKPDGNPPHCGRGWPPRRNTKFGTRIQLEINAGSIQPATDRAIARWRRYGNESYRCWQPSFCGRLAH